MSEFTFENLLKMAKEAYTKSYSPYSGFPVGSALLAENDEGETKVFSGCNVENASFSLCLCAERNSVVQAISHGFKNFKTVAIAAANLSPCRPCGACLQVLAEFQQDLTLVLEGEDGNPIVKKLSDFLPEMFTSDLLIKNSSIKFKH